MPSQRLSRSSEGADLLGSAEVGAVASPLQTRRSRHYLPPILTTAITSAVRVEVWVGFGVLVWLLLSILVAAYGRTLGYPVFPLALCAFFLGPLGWVIVLLVVTVAGGRLDARPVVSTRANGTQATRRVPAPRR